jgi:hypothetical protein
MAPPPSPPAARLAAQLLAGPPGRDAVAVVDRLLAVQAQDPRGARLAVRARSTGLAAADVDRALTDERSLVVTWLNRGTLHLVRREDYPWLQALTAPPQVIGNARRLAQEGVTAEAADRGVAVIERSLADEGPLNRDRLRERLDSAGVRTEGQALVHLLMLACLRGLAVRGPMAGSRQAYVLACLRGLAVRGPMAGSRQAYVLVRDWLGPARPVERETALAELARRYLAGHGPADDRDLAKWAGLPLRDARAALRAIAPELQPQADGLVDLPGRRMPPAPPPPRLLGAFDPVLLGWRSREPILGGHAPRVTVGGLFRPFALVRGRAAATWRLERGEVRLEPFGGLARSDSAALRADAGDVIRYLGERGDGR